MKKIIIFGASASGRTAYMMLKKEYEVIGFSDNDQKKWGTMFCNVKIYHPSELPSFVKKDVGIVIASVYYTAINRQLISMGITNNKLFYYFGNSMEQSYNGKYKMIDLSEQDLFSTCRYDSDMVKKIEKDFLVNYPKDNSTEKVSLKDTKKKKVLFCAYIFPPIGGSGTQRSLKFVKYLREFGWEPIVLTVGENDKKLGEDSTLLRELPDDITVIRIDDPVYIPEVMTLQQQQQVYNLYAAVMQDPAWLQEFCTIIKNSPKGYKLIPDNHICWVNECLKQIDSLIDFSQIDMIFTTGNPFSDYVLGWFLKRKYNIPWVQDYRDPWTSNDYYIENYYKEQADTMTLQKQLENRLVQEADGIVGVYELCKKEFQEKFNIPQSRVSVIKNGYDEEDFKDVVTDKIANEKFTLCYNGTIYIDRNPIFLISIINVLISEGTIKADKIQLLINGTVTQYWKDKIKEVDCNNIVVYNGILEHEQSIKVASTSDLLILFGCMDEGAEVIATGKVYEYLKMPPEIICFSKTGGVLDQLLKETASGCNFEYEKEKVKTFLSDRYQMWKNGSRDRGIRKKNITNYSRKELTKQLAGVFERILGE